MELLKRFFEPLHSLKWRQYLLLVGLQLAIVLTVWELRGGGLIPGPSKIITAFFHLLSTPAFYENLMASLSLTATAMIISIIVALFISYLAFIPFFKPLSDFVMKCRYLTLTGLIFLFTLITQNGGQLKLSLLVFGIVPFFVTSMLSILSSIYKEEFDLCRTLRMSRWRSWWETIIVGRLDQVFEVMRQNFAIAWLMITMVEGLSMSEGGLGTMMIKSNKYIDLGNVFSILLVILLFGVAFDYLLGLSRRWIFPYTRFQVEEE
jgi:ABC-type nitrate/sulfonate/bicarbonate transport system permease component